MRHLFPLFLILSCLLTFLPGCEPKEDMVQTSGGLEFSTDSVKFDTVFTSITTVTKRLWVYNRNAGAVRVERISLGNQTGTVPYQLIVSGDAGNSASNVLIRGKDSLLVLVKAVLGANDSLKPFLLEDQIHFQTNGNDQNVKLVAFGQNAYFHDGQVLPCTSIWRNDKPHVIYNSVQVNPGCVLRIMPGTRVYSHAGSAIIVLGTLLVNTPADYQPGTGATDTIKANNRNIVRFQGDRLEPFYADVPGQWGGIIFLASGTSSSQGNVIRYAEIKNATFGALLYNPDGVTPHPDLTLSNTVIRNISGSNISFANAASSTGGGVISTTGNVTATNCLFTNCGEYAVLGVGGGDYDFNFCTFANYTPAFHRETSTLTFTNELKTSTGTTVTRPTNVNLRNSIVWGSFEDELFVQNYTAYASLSIRNTLVRSLEYATNTAVLGSTNLNTDPLFVRISLTSSIPDYRLQATSPARSRPAADPSTVPTRDLLNLPRPSLNTVSLGAYK